jgi:predicted Zn-dependent peptidase
MLFKGTSQKSSLDIVKIIEGMGGSFDAYTTKETLIIITKFLSEHINRVFDLIAEILLESKIAEDELNKEKSVVLEEIKSNDEDPDDYVFDLFFKALFKNHSMGLPIAGTKDTVERIDADNTKRHYQELLEKGMTIAISGNFDYQELLNLTQAKFANLDFQHRKRTKPTFHPDRLIIQKKNEISQVHCLFGLPGIEYSSPLRYKISLLNTAFGGGMSSRLFQGLREKEGLVYNVQSLADLYSDCGIFGFYFVCDKNNLEKVARSLRMIFNEIHKSGFSKEEIELAKTYLSGNLLLSLESSTNRMLRIGREMLYLKKTYNIDEVINNIRSINVDQINALIEKFLDPNKYTIAAVGPISEKEVEETFTFS